MAMAPSSPRLPSPPPQAEIQIGPKSPSGGANATLQTTQMEQSVLDANSKRRIHPGTKAADMASGPPLVPLNELNSAFQLQEHLAALHYHHSSSGREAISREAAAQLAQPPQGIDRTLWLYELCRFLISQCNSLIVGFLFDTPACSATTCPEMRASEWQFLCAVHEQPKSCCAIDYCCHTLDWAANVVTDQKIFPSRFVVLNDPSSKNIGVRNLVNVFRRLHRIFAHAWFQHRRVFWSVEGQTGLYVFFKTVCDLYDLLPAENYKLPPEAEGLEPPAAVEAATDATKQPPPQILKPPSPQQRGLEDDGMNATSRTNTRRHIRGSPSTGSAVTTVIEADEEDNDGVARRMRQLHISAPEIVTEEEPETADVPVLVEDPSMTPTQQLPSEQPAEEEDQEEEYEDGGGDDESEANVTVIEGPPIEDEDAASTEEKANGPEAETLNGPEPMTHTEEHNTEGNAEETTENADTAEEEKDEAKE